MRDPFCIRCIKMLHIRKKKIFCFDCYNCFSNLRLEGTFYTIDFGSLLLEVATSPKEKKPKIHNNLHCEIVSASFPQESYEQATKGCYSSNCQEHLRFQPSFFFFVPVIYFFIYSYVLPWLPFRLNTYFLLYRSGRPKLHAHTRHCRKTRTFPPPRQEARRGRRRLHQRRVRAGEWGDVRSARPGTPAPAPRHCSEQ